MGEMMGDQIANQAAKPLKKGGKKKKNKKIVNTSCGTVELQAALVVLLLL
jgi:hypothetical protein